MQPINNKKELMKKQIPTLVGLGVLVVGLIVAVTFLGVGPGVFAPRATSETTPSKIKITNLTDSGFTVSFYTSSATPGFIKYGTEANSVKSQTGDDRDQLSGTVGDYQLHHITLRGLKPDTTYYYTLGTGSSGTFDNNGAPFTIKTASRDGAPSAAKTIYGNVLTSSASPANGAVVYAVLPGVGEMSSLVKSSGSWAIPLSNARKSDGSGYAVVEDSDVVTLFVQGVTPTLVSNLTVEVANSQPVADITLGTDGNTVSANRVDTAIGNDPGFDPVISNNLDNNTSSGNGSDSSLATTNTTTTGNTANTINTSNSSLNTGTTGSLSGLNNNSSTTGLGGLSDQTEGQTESSLTTTTTTTSDIEEVSFVDFEIEEDQVVTTQTPSIGGIAVPDVTVSIVVNSDTQIEQELVADENGYFVLDIEALKQTLEPGEHTATYTYTDPTTGLEVTKTVNFTVEPNSNIGGTTQTTPFGSGNPYSISDATNSSKVINESTSSTKTSTRSAVPATTSAVPVSGSVGTTMALVFGGIFFIIAGGWSYYLATQIEVNEI